MKNILFFLLAEKTFWKNGATVKVKYKTRRAPHVTTTNCTIFIKYFYKAYLVLTK